MVGLRAAASRAASIRWLRVRITGAQPSHRRPRRASTSCATARSSPPTGITGSLFRWSAKDGDEDARRRTSRGPADFCVRWGNPSTCPTSSKAKSASSNWECNEQARRPVRPQPGLYAAVTAPSPPPSAHRTAGGSKTSIPTKPHGTPTPRRSRHSSPSSPECRAKLGSSAKRLRECLDLLY